MEWVLMGAIVLVLATVGVALLVRANRGGAAGQDEEIDPLFVAGIAITGSGAAIAGAAAMVLKLWVNCPISSPVRSGRTMSNSPRAISVARAGSSTQSSVTTSTWRRASRASRWP